MKRLKIDKAPLAVKTFLRGLVMDHEGLELELNGQLLCKIIPPMQFSEAEQQALVQQRWKLIRKARQRNKAVPARIIERDVREAVNLVRQRRK